ncbi:helix-turn-helix domain-containing protein [Amphibacillus jilinensis]|uniref:helix-turn-helix domain-containing protein n=1 Tax=Amphibacillus jilinensis TaxID=1216008 RepID=UPI00031690B3|nr:helix-turn-helix transcriptional regulator [Amphibacillus jilinensis]
MSTLERVKGLCKSRGISVARLEDELNIPKNTIYQWNRISPSLDKIKAIADYFQVSVDYLLGRTDQKNLDEPETIAAHMDDDLSEEELEDIKKYIQFIKSRRN